MSEPPRLRLGAELRSLRRASRTPPTIAGRFINRSRAGLYRIEDGHAPLSPDEARQLADLYGADPLTTDRLAQLAEAYEPHARSGWWDEHGGPPSAWFTDYLAAEEQATCIGMWYPTLVPGLLQTSEYARAAIVVDDPAEVQRQVGIRLRRQRILDRPGPLANVSVMLGEAALRRVVGSADILRSQLYRLATLASYPHVHIGVVPFAAPAHPGMGSGPLVLLGTQMVYLESLRGATYLYDEKSVADHRVLLERIGEACLPEDESLDLLVRLAGKRDHRSGAD